MTSRLLMKSVLLGGLSALLSVATAQANGHHHNNYDTAYVPSVLAVPTSYVSTGYLVPSSYVDVLYPTIYSSPVLSPTIYAEPTAYVVTGRRSVGRPIYTRTSSVYYGLTPTTYSLGTYWPTSTTYELPLLSSTPTTYSDDCVVTTSAPAASASSVPAVPNRTQGSAVPPPRLDSIPQNGAGAGNNAVGGYVNEPAPAQPAEDLFNTAPPAGSGPVEPPLTPTPEKENGGVVAPPLSTGSPPLDQYSHTANRPVPTEFNPQTSSSIAPGALRGQVVDRKTRTPLAGITVVFSDLQRTYADKLAKTDANGQFEVLLPNADWSVSIVEADGTNTPYENRITSTGGRFYDAFGRAVSSLRLNH